MVRESTAAREDLMLSAMMSPGVRMRDAPVDESETFRGSQEQWACQ
jgi:hypothetical protein